MKHCLLFPLWVISRCDPFLLICGGMIAAILFALAVSFAKPLRTDYPFPLDVCPNTNANTVVQGNITSVDYVNRRGDTVYLVYKMYSMSNPVLHSKQVIEGDDCPQ